MKLTFQNLRYVLESDEIKHLVTFEPKLDELWPSESTSIEYDFFDQLTNVLLNLYNLALNAAHRGKPDFSKQCVDLYEAFVDAFHLTEYKETGFIDIMKAQICEYAENTGGAIFYYLKAVNAMVDTKEVDQDLLDFQLARVYSNLARLYQEIGDQEESLFYTQSFYSAARAVFENNPVDLTATLLIDAFNQYVSEFSEWIALQEVQQRLSEAIDAFLSINDFTYLRNQTASVLYQNLLMILTQLVNEEPDNLNSHLILDLFKAFPDLQDHYDLDPVATAHIQSFLKELAIQLGLEDQYTQSISGSLLQSSRANV